MILQVLTLVSSSSRTPRSESSRLTFGASRLSRVMMFETRRFSWCLSSFPGPLLQTPTTLLSERPRRWQDGSEGKGAAKVAVAELDVSVLGGELRLKCILVFVK